MFPKNFFVRGASSLAFCLGGTACASDLLFECASFLSGAGKPVLTGSFRLPVPSGVCPLGHVPQVRPYRRAGYARDVGCLPLCLRQAARPSYDRE